jgi:hypothetical protein
MRDQRIVVHGFVPLRVVASSFSKGGRSGRGAVTFFVLPKRVTKDNRRLRRRLMPAQPA